MESRRLRIEWIKANIPEYEKIDALFDRYKVARVRDALLTSGLYTNTRWIDETSLQSLILAAQGKRSYKTR